MLDCQNNIFKLQNILDDIKLNNINNTNAVTSKNDSIEKIVDNLNLGQAIEDMNKIINKLISNNIESINNKNNIINNSCISEDMIFKGNKNHNNSMDKNLIEEKDIIKTLNNMKDNKNGFNPKIQQIINFNDKNNNNLQYNISNIYNINNNENNIEQKIKDDNIALIANSLNNKKLIKKPLKKDGEKKFLNKFVNVDK